MILWNMMKEKNLLKIMNVFIVCKIELKKSLEKL